MDGRAPPVSIFILGLFVILKIFTGRKFYRIFFGRSDYDVESLKKPLRSYCGRHNSYYNAKLRRTIGTQVGLGRQTSTDVVDEIVRNNRFGYFLFFISYTRHSQLIVFDATT